MTILVVEDEQRVSDFLQRGLRAEGYRVVAARSAEEALRTLRSEQFSLLLLDIRLPGMNGIELCQLLRSERNATPVLMLTAMDSVQDRVAGLKCGADDYLTKPFAFEELLARIEALLRRPQRIESPPTQLSVADLVFDRSSMQVTRAGQPVTLTAKELALLELLMSAPGRVFSRERILSNVWGTYEDPLTNVVDVYVRRLRSKIDEGQSMPLIHTVRGMGYRLNA